ncbi:MAG: helix-turn-helix domain-containing protein [Erysipelotrichaceae bacterium]|nr:helix-turn-helix domain-containing protein [Erysipelotrichaceae bacterium]
MNEKIIEQLLPLTEKEKRYKAGEKSKFLSMLPYILIDGKEVAYMTYQSAPNAAHPFIQIRTQSRYQDWPLHCHNWIEINYMLKGGCTQVINDTEYLIEEGGFALIDEMTPHNIRKLEKNDLLINICISKDYLSSTFFHRLSENSLLLSFFTQFLNKKVNTNHFVIYPQGSRKLDDIMSVFLSEWLEPGFSYIDMIDSLFQAIVSELINIHSQHIGSSGKEMSPKIFNALKYIEKNYPSCTLTDLADELELNPNYASNLIKEQTGYTFNQLLQFQRIGMAKKLLLHTNLTIEEIGESVGYQNMNFFYKKFKERTGLTPGDFRKNI